MSDAINDCADVRSMAYSVLNPVLPLTHVGRYGNSDPSNVSEWISIINETTGSTDEVHIIGPGQQFCASQNW